MFPFVSKTGFKDPTVLAKSPLLAVVNLTKDVFWSV